jgi:redox-sensitive bicupin YhaK (pirin superfamily)
MITIRRSGERGHFNHGWLDTHHTFSFASYFDPAHMGFRALRVLNDDRVAPGRGFGAHAHRDMEILTYVLDGRLAHKDSMGEQHVFGANTIQTMSAGTGVIHSEFNASQTDPVRFLQIWIEPAVSDVDPSYQQIPFAPDEKHNRFRLLASPDGQGQNGSRATIHQDAFVYAAELDPGKDLRRPLAAGRHAWVQVARGNIDLNGELLEEGDGAAVSHESDLAFLGKGPNPAEFLLFDLA